MGRTDADTSAESPKSRSRLIKDWATDLGFDLIGIARAESLGDEAEALKDWIGNRRHAGMVWLANSLNRRIDPSRVLVDCRSIVVTTLNYYRNHEEAADNKSGEVGKVALYAQSRDYHKVIGGRMRALAERIETELSPANAKWYVDTGPVMEKAWAQRAGIGFIGKNTCLINPRRGSWLFLAVILTDLELDCDTPAENACGSCTRCIEACPTGALDEPGVLDSNLCISYLNIEHRGEVAPELHSQFEGWLFGCDICQEVCPYNVKFAEPIGETAMLGAALLPSRLGLGEILAMGGEEEFRSAFGGDCALRRAGLGGLQRTAGILRNENEVVMLNEVVVLSS